MSFWDWSALVVVIVVVVGDLPWFLRLPRDEPKNLEPMDTDLVEWLKRWHRAGETAQLEIGSTYPKGCFASG